MLADITAASATIRHSRLCNGKSGGECLPLPPPASLPRKSSRGAIAPRV